MESLKLNKYLETLKKREKTKPKTRLQEIVEPYYPEWEWRDETFEDDMRAVWIAIKRYMKWRTEAQLIALLNWTKGKAIYPLSLTKILNKK